MSTRAAIVRATGPGTFAGRYVHFDGYPAAAGQELWYLYHETFGENLGRMLEALIDEHPAGWSSLGDYPAGCYCHGGGGLPRLTVTQRNAYRLCCEYVYAFGADANGQPTMRILMAEDEPEDYARGRSNWETVIEVELDGEAPNWDTFCSFPG